MRIKKVTGIGRKFFQPQLRKKFGLEGYQDGLDRNEPLLIFGIDKKNALRAMEHQGLCVIVWTGTDTIYLKYMKWFINFLLQNTNRIFHITYSHWNRIDLDHFGIPYIQRLVIPSDMSWFKYEPMDLDFPWIYHYTSNRRPWYYGTDAITYIVERENLGMIRANHFSYTQEQLYEIYKDSLMGIRLTEHDGIAGSVIEMGLMGRKTIFNGDYPCAINYGYPYIRFTPEVSQRRVQEVTSPDYITNITAIIHRSLKENPEPSKELAEEMKEFIQDDEAWLDTKFYTG